MTTGAAVSSRSDLGAYAPPASAGTTRISSLDIARGLVMVLMAIDHVRVYSGVPAGGPTYGVFFTRWVTHFVAPAFVFFAGTAAYLHGRKLADAAALSKFLFLRGAWLILLELTVIRVCWTFNMDFAHYMLAGVIWMLGWCMILMAALSRLPLAANAVLGGAIIALHNVMDGVPALTQSQNPGALWSLLYAGGVVQLGSGGPPLFILYVLVPWIGVMMTGYAFGAVMTLPAERRGRVILRIGAAAIVAFLVLRAADLYGDPRHWHQSPPAAAATQAAPNVGASRPAAPALIRFLNTTKYPASLSFLLMTLGPMLIFLGNAERIRGGTARVLETFGRVPFFYYLLHIPLIHLAACVVSLIREGRVDPWLFTNHPMDPGPLPEGYRWSLGLLYLVWAVCVATLYWPCAWYAKLRAAKKSALLSYL